MRGGFPNARGHRRLLGALSVDALGTGLFLPFSILYFTATTDLALGRVGLALSIAAFIRIPATAGAGMFCDRFGPRTTVIASNVAQAVGFANYLLVGSFAHLLIAALVVQVGNSAFWVAYPALVHDVADGQQQEPWFALITALRNAGLAIGALGASLAVAVGGTNGYTAIVAVNAISFAAAAVLTRLDKSGTHTGRGDGERDESSWTTALRDLPFLGFVVLNVGFALLSLAFVVAVPVFLVRTVDLPQWMPGTILALNAVLGAIGAAPIVAIIAGHRRHRSLITSQAIIGFGFAAVLCCAYAPLAVGIGLAVVAAVLVTTTELVQGLIVPSIVNEAASSASRGRYNSLYQMAFSIGDIVTPGLMTALLAHGAVATWTPLLALAAVNMVGVVLLARWLPAMRRRVERSNQVPSNTSRLIEADSL
jgi:MFS family permease